MQNLLWIGQYQLNISPLTESWSLYFKAKQLIYRILFKKKHLRDREPLIFMNNAKQVAKKLSKLDVDVVFSPGTIPIAYLECIHPIVFWTDVTFGGMIDFYLYFYGSSPN